MLKFLLGAVVGAIVTAQYLRRGSRHSTAFAGSGRVDELSTAARTVITNPALNAGDGTPASQPRFATNSTVT